MRRARRPALFHYALAAALAAITIPFIAHAAFGEEAVTTPTAQVFPTRQGIGVTWNDVDASTYRVERKQSADWQDISGPLTDATTTWIDETIPAGATADYRVVATTDADPTTSAAVTATRVAEAPAVGDIDVLSLDANRGAGTTWLQDETASPVTASAPVDGSRTLTAGSLKVKLPALVAGPGYYNLPSLTAVTLTQGDRSCTSAATLRVTAVTYTPDQQLETFAASLAAGTCEGADAVAWYEIRYRSALGYQALSVTPDRADAGTVQYGKTANIPITVKNVGTTPVKLSGTTWRFGPSSEWTIADNDCPASLPVAAGCGVIVTFRPGQIGPSWNTLTLHDSTSLEQHSVTVSGTGVDVPAALDVTVRPTYNGHTVGWRSLQTAGGTTVRGYNLHRFVNGAETVEWFPAKSSTGDFAVIEPSTTPGIEYAVSVVNEVGEGPTGVHRPVPRATEQIAITQGEPDSRDLVAADQFRNVVPFPADPNSVKPKEAVTSSPDGRSLAYVTSTTERTLWTQKVAPGDLGVPVKLWSSATPITHLSWSPDGTRIAFQAPENGTPCVYVIAATGGTPTKVACQLSSPSWMPDARTLVVSDHRLTPSRLATVEATAGGTRNATLPGQAEVADGRPVRASADGQYVAFGDGSTVRLTGTMERTSPSLDSEVRAITWDPSGTWILALTAGGRLYQLGMAIGGDLYLYNELATGTNRADLTWQRLGVTIKPTPAVMGPDISIPFDGSAFPAGTRFTCEVKGSFMPAETCTSPFTARELRSGNYQVTVRASAPDGTGATAYRNITVDATGPVARMVAPAYQSSVAATATLMVSATDANGVASYDVQHRRATSAGPYGAYVQPWTNTTATSMNLAVAAGYEYCVSVRAKDKLGNVGQWSAERCFSRPLDDRSLTLASTGWTRATGSTFYYGTTTQTTAYGKSLTRTVQGKRFFLVATRCPTCGSVAVYAGNRYLTTVKLAYPTTHRQVLLGLPVQSTLFSGTLKLVSASTGKLVQIDGLAVGRT
jgi:WD40 repeat protein